MEKLNIIELIVNTRFDEEQFNALIDPAGSLTPESRQAYWNRFESGQQDVINFYQATDGDKSEVDYIKRSINSYFDQKAAERLKEQRIDLKEQDPSDKKIKPIDDLDGSASWGFNDDVKWK